MLHIREIQDGEELEQVVHRDWELLAHRSGKLCLQAFQRDSYEHCVKGLLRGRVQKQREPLQAPDHVGG